MKINIKTVLLLLVILKVSGTGDIYAQNNVRKYSIGVTRNLFVEVNTTDATAACKLWFNEISRKIKGDMELDVKVINEANDITYLKKNDNLVVLALNIFQYFQYKEKISLQPVLMPSYKGKTNFEFQILVRKDKHFKTLNDLKGKTLGMPNNYDPVASRIWIETLCAKNKIKDVDNYFSKIVETPKESQLLMDVFFGKIDVCLVRKSTVELVNELNPQIGQSISAMYTSPAFPVAVVCFLDNFNNEPDKNSIVQNGIQIHNSTYGKQFTTLMGIDKLVPFNEASMINYTQLLGEYKKYVPAKKSLLLRKF